MPAVAILLLLLILFWAYIVCDRRRFRNSKDAPLTREEMVKGFLPKGLEKWKLWISLSAMFCMFGVIQLLEQKLPPFVGRWSWLDSWLYLSFGPTGKGFFSLSIAIIMLAASIHAWSKQRP
jgi:hypothetical protein